MRTFRGGLNSQREARLEGPGAVRSLGTARQGLRGRDLRGWPFGRSFGRSFDRGCPEAPAGAPDRLVRQARKADRQSDCGEGRSTRECIKGDERGRSSRRDRPLCSVDARGDCSGPRLVAASSSPNNLNANSFRAAGSGDGRESLAISESPGLRESPGLSLRVSQPSILTVTRRVLSSPVCSVRRTRDPTATPESIARTVPFASRVTEWVFFSPVMTSIFLPGS